MSADPVALAALEQLPLDPAVEATVAVLREAADPYDRALPAHVTASAVVLDPERTRVLLVHHGKLGLWVQPGGHVDPGDSSVAAAALREAVEETGVAELALLAGPLDVDRHPAPCRPAGEADHLDVLYAVTAPADAVPVASSESRDVGWFALDALPLDAVPGLAARLLRAVQAVSSTR